MAKSFLNRYDIKLESYMFDIRYSQSTNNIANDDDDGRSGGKIELKQQQKNNAKKS